MREGLYHEKYQSDTRQTLNTMQICINKYYKGILQINNKILKDREGETFCFDNSYRVLVLMIL